MFKPKFTKFKVKGYEALAIYDYDETIKNYLYQFKGCFDYELKDIFLERYKKILKFRFRNYILVPIPSFSEDDKKREFNHVIEIFNLVKTDMANILRKTEHYKQSDHSANDRNQVKKFLEISPLPQYFNKKILLVDDVYTTGSTMKACIELVKTLNPKDIKILVLSKTIFKI